MFDVKSSDGLPELVKVVFGQVDLADVKMPTELKKDHLAVKSVFNTPLIDPLDIKWADMSGYYF